MEVPYNKIIEDFLIIDFDLLAVPIIAVYKNPSDFPQKYVARLFDVQRPTPYIVVSDNLDDIRKAIPSEMIGLKPSKRDDPILVETWV